MSLFKQRKNKSFSYKTKQQREQEKLQKDDLTSKWDAMRGTSKRSGSFFSSLPIMVLFLIAVLILLYILGRY